MSALRVLAPIVFAVAVMILLALAGLFAHVPTLELIQVLDVAPRDLEVGDRMAIVGAGFPPGKPARITFRGTLHRPGEPADRGVAIEATGAVVSPQRVELRIDEAIQSRFCQQGERAVHTTFDGELEVAFAAATVGVAPVGGVLRGVALDFRPSARPFDVDREAEGERFLGFVGIHAASGTRETGVLVRDVAAGSAADNAGIAAGDVLVRFDGLRVQTVGDVLPAPGEDEAEIGIRRGGSSTETARTVLVGGFRPAASLELLGAWLAVVTALMAVLLWGAATPPLVARAAESVMSRVRARCASGGERRPAGHSPLAGFAKTVLLAALPRSRAAATPALAVCAALAVLPFGQCPAFARADVGILFVAVATALAAAAAMAAGSPSRAASAVFHVVWQHVPGAIAIANVVLATGSLSIRELGRAQDGWPSDWLAFRSPALLATMFVLIRCARIPARPPQPLGAPSRRWLVAIEGGHRLAVAGLVTALFLGGWSLPGLTAAQQDSRPALQAAGAATYLAKLFVVALVIAASSWMAPARTYREQTYRTAVVFLPLSAACFLASVASSGWGPPAAFQRLGSASLVAVALFVAVGCARRLILGLRPGAADAHLSPFL
ncbi:MAG TPA: PDZ domain-containing protein [Polyangiaceae bacterium]|nr:PDZ domain-containing protein [Polyangiaceae bacterium]